MSQSFRNWKVDIVGANERKNIVIVVSGLLLFFAYLIVGLGLGRKTVISSDIPYFIIIALFSFSIVFGYSFLCFLFLRMKGNKFYQHGLEQYFHQFGFIFLLMLPLPDYYVYFFPKEIKTYWTDYEIVKPGPRIDKISRCNAGIRIKSADTKNEFFLCFKEKEHVFLGNKALVTVKSNKIGAYLESYNISKHS